MKKALWRVTCLLLCGVILFGLIPVTSFAATPAGVPVKLTWGKVPYQIYDEKIGDWNYDYQYQKSVPGMISWQTSIPDTGSALVEVFYEGGTKLASGSWTHDAESTWHFSDDFYSNVTKSGKYYFTVTTLGDNGQYNDSQRVTSETWTYTKPSNKLPTVTKLGWENAEPYWVDPTSEAMDSYEIHYYYQKSPSDTPQLVRKFSRIIFTGTEYTTWSWGDGSVKQMFAHNGEGYYSFKIRGYSQDITQMFHSDWSPMSESYHLTRSKIENAQDQNYALSELVVGDDGYYRTPNGQLVYIAVDNDADMGLFTWLYGNTLADYVEAYGEEYFDMSKWDALLALMDKDGYVKLDKTSYGYLKTTVMGNPKWADTEADLPNYLMYDRVASTPANVTRLAGKDRFDTAFKVADQLKSVLGVSKFDSIIVASGATFADALPGSYLAAVKNAPILLSYSKGKYNDQAKDYIRKNLKPGGTVYILGGTSAVPTSMEQGLDDFKVVRLAGEDRFGTNLEILKEAGVTPGQEILVCTAKDFADSLSASATGLPILLVYKKLTNEQKAFLSKLSGNSFSVVGGTAAVSENLAEEIKSYGSVTRLAGDDRLKTSNLVAQKYFKNANSAVVAYGWNYPDGLCGGPLAYAMKAPLMLTHSKTKLYGTTASYTTGAGIKNGYILGGTGLITDEAVRAIFSMSAKETINVK